MQCASKPWDLDPMNPSQTTRQKMGARRTGACRSWSLIEPEQRSSEAFDSVQFPHQRQIPSAGRGRVVIATSKCVQLIPTGVGGVGQVSHSHCGFDGRGCRGPSHLEIAQGISRCDVLVGIVEECFAHAADPDVGFETMCLVPEGPIPLEVRHPLRRSWQLSCRPTVVLPGG